jgi:hypothetical protein
MAVSHFRRQQIVIFRSVGKSMAIAVPNLDDRAYADLVDEARGLIPVYDPSWTNHNPSDPGITLIELFAWLTEMQIYALDQITDAHRVTFLRLLRGPELTPARTSNGSIRQAWLDRETATTLKLLRQTTRAVSAGDYEVLAGGVAGVKRARCVPRRNLDAGTEAARLVAADGHVSVVILRDAEVGERDAEALCAAVTESLMPARMLATRLHVVLPTWVPVAARVTVARRADVKPDELESRIKNRLADWLSPWTGGDIGGDGDGWPFGRDVYVSELNAVLEAIPGVDYVGDALLDSQASGTPGEQSAPPIWHDSGALVGLALADHQLPRSSADSHQVIVADRLEPVSITVSVVPQGTDLAATRRAVMQVLRDFLWTLQNIGREFTLSEVDIRKSLAAAAVMAVVASIGTISIVARRGAAPSYDFKAGEFFQADCTVVIAAPAS